MRILLRISIVILAVTALLAADSSQVTVLLTVKNQRNQFVNGLTAQHFKVYEDGKLQTATHFGSAASIPLTLLFAVDKSGSSRNASRLQDVMSQVFSSSIRPGQDRAAVMTFNESVLLVQNLTDDPVAFTTAVRSMDQMRGRGGTALFDALYQAASFLAQTPGRRNIIFISDGNDNASKVRYKDVLALLRANGVTVHAITLGYVSGQVSNVEDLKTIAAETGGQSFVLSFDADLSRALKEIGTGLREQYAITYESSNIKQDGKFRKIRIEMGKIKDVTTKLTYRPGYYLEPPK